MLKLLSKLPLTLLYGLASLAYFINYYVIRYRRDIVEGNITAAFPEKTPPEIKRLVKAFYQHQANLAAEIIKAYSMSPEELQRRMVFTNLECLQKYADQQQSVLMMGGHLWNWEWVLLSGQLHSPMTVSTLYKPLHNESAEHFFHTSRSRFGGTPIGNKNAAKEIIKRRRQTEAFAILSDQAPSRKEPHIWTQFMNQDSIFHTGPERIAQVTQYPIIFTRTRRIKRGYYECELVPMAEPPYSKTGNELTLTYIAHLEQAINEQPEGWLWSNRRWKKSRRPEEQPTKT